MQRGEAAGGLTQSRARWPALRVCRPGSCWVSSEIPVERRAQNPAEKPKAAPVAGGGDATLLEAVKELEMRMIRDALRRSDGSVMKAAKELGISRKGLYMKMGRFNFEN